MMIVSVSRVSRPKKSVAFKKLFSLKKKSVANSEIGSPFGSKTHYGWQCKQQKQKSN